MLKLIITSGLYPNLCIGDTANYVRGIGDQVFHTKDKRNVMMHPSSVFSLKPQLTWGERQGNKIQIILFSLHFCLKEERE